jgi:uncharacterized protein (DUF736 family)
MAFEKDPNEIGALWSKTGAKGEYMTGTINGEPVVLFRNTNKRSEKAPDWRVLKSQPRERTQPTTAPSTDDESIPF